MSRMGGIMQVLGLGLITAGVTIVAPWAGMIVAGLSLLAVGVAMEIGSRAR